MSQHPYISQELLQDPCLRFMSYSILIIRFCGPAQAKRKLCPPETRFVWPCAGKTVRPRSAGAFRGGDTQILSYGDAFCVALRRENSPTECFAQAKRKFWTAEMHFVWPCAGETQILTSGDASSVQMKWIHEESRPDEQNRHGATARRQKIYPATVSRRRNANFDLWSRVFLWPCAVKTEGTENLHLDLRGFTPTVRTPQCATLFGEKS